MKRIIITVLLFFMLIPTSVSAAYIDGQTWDKIQTDFPTAKLKAAGVPTTFLEQLHVNWKTPTGGKYPDLNKYKNVNILVSLEKQRVYIKDGNKTIYTMICSAGVGGNTPRGDFAIEQERGTKFYNPDLKEGANYWTSFKNHGVYLFHTVPTNVNGNYNVDEADKLGTEASHGCVRLSNFDAKWINDEIKFGTKVKVV